MIAQVVGACCVLAINIIIARSYGAAMVGIVAVINSFLLLSTIFTVMGTNTSLLRLIPEHMVMYSPTSAFKVYRKTQLMVIILSIMTGIFLFLASSLIADKIFKKPHLSPYFAIASVFLVFKSLELLNIQAVRGLRLIKIFALMQVLPYGLNLLILLLLGLFLPYKNLPVYAFLGGIAITGTMGWLFMESSFKKKIRPLDTIKPMAVKDILAISFPMLLTATMSFAMGQAGIIIIGMFRSEAEVGYYAIAVKLSSLTIFILNAVNSMVASKFSELFHTGKIEELFYIAKKSAKLVFITTVPIMFSLLIFGKFILGVAFGNNFKLAYPSLILLIIGQFVNSISGSTGIFMNMTENHNVFRNIIISTGIFNMALNFLLIPGLGMYGAAFSAMISICFWNIITLLYMKNKFGKTTGYFPFLGYFFNKKANYLSGL